METKETSWHQLPLINGTFWVPSRRTLSSAAIGTLLTVVLAKMGWLTDTAYLNTYRIGIAFVLFVLYFVVPDSAHEKKSKAGVAFGYGVAIVAIGLCLLYYYLKYSSGGR